MDLTTFWDAIFPWPTSSPGQSSVSSAFRCVSCRPIGRRTLDDSGAAVWRCYLDPARCSSLAGSVLQDGVWDADEAEQMRRGALDVIGKVYAYMVALRYAS